MNLIDENDAIELAGLLKLFADPTRVKILCSLLEGEKCVCDISAFIGVSQSAVSHSLRVLKDGKLVKKRRDGQAFYYSLADEHVKTIITMGLEHIKE